MNNSDVLLEANGAAKNLAYEGGLFINYFNRIVFWL